MNKEWSSILLIFSLSSTLQANENLKNFDPGFQLNKTIQENLHRKLEQKPDSIDPIVQKPDDVTSQHQNNKEITFYVKKIKVNSSQIILDQELRNLTEAYEQKTLNISQLYQLINQINERYAEEQCIVCRAFLLEQNINDGIVEIQLVEGKTGKVIIENNSYLNSKYILKRLPSLVEDRISRISELNKDLRWFNSNEDTKLTVTLQAGERPYTTDYVVQVKEPERDSFWISTDSLGYQTTGNYRLSGTYLLRNITGFGDQIDMNTTLSEGTSTFSINYMQPIMASGIKLMLGHSSNDLEAVRGIAKDISLEGNSSSHHIGLVSPLFIEENWKLQGNLEYRELRSTTEILKQDWIKDAIDIYNLGFNGYYLFDKSFLNFSTLFSYGQWKDINKDELDFSTFNLNLMYHLPLDLKNMIQMRLNLQKSFNDHTPSASQFSATGYYATRGYEEGSFSSLSGANFNLDYIHVLNNHISLKLFSDLGWMDVSDDSLLMSIGTELEWQPLNKTHFSLQFATPIIRELNNIKVDTYTVNFKLYRNF